MNYSTMMAAASMSDDATTETNRYEGTMMMPMTMRMPIPMSSMTNEECMVENAIPMAEMATTERSNEESDEQNPLSYSYTTDDTSLMIHNTAIQMVRSSARTILDASAMMMIPRVMVTITMTE